MARLLPETADGLLDLMNSLFPEPRPSPKESDEEIRYALARRSVYLQLRDAYNQARKKDTGPIVHR